MLRLGSEVLDDSIRKAIERCPKRQGGNMEELEERIREMEENIETGSFDIKAEREVCLIIHVES